MLNSEAAEQPLPSPKRDGKVGSPPATAQGSFSISIGNRETVVHPGELQNMG